MINPKLIVIVKESGVNPNSSKDMVEKILIAPIAINMFIIINGIESKKDTAKLPGSFNGFQPFSISSRCKSSLNLGK